VVTIIINLENNNNPNPELQDNGLMRYHRATSYLATITGTSKKEDFTS
jgi:hypothetical protein